MTQMLIKNLNCSVVGSSWSPQSPSGSLVLIFSLCFALVIYNAYAAYITSVLSVHVASIRGLGDLLQSDFQFGYTLRGQDEAFLRVGNLYMILCIGTHYPQFVTWFSEYRITFEECSHR